jgi:hypothetical protein
MSYFLVPILNSKSGTLGVGTMVFESLWIKNGMSKLKKMRRLGVALASSFILILCFQNCSGGFKSVQPPSTEDIASLGGANGPGAISSTSINRKLLNVGGGFTSGGIFGQYYANTSLSGTPSFTRTDVRLDFASGNSSWGGSIDTAYNIPATGFSAQWSGQVVAVFSETYTFSLNAGGEARLYLRPTGSNTYQKIIDTGSAASGTGSYSLTAGVSYDIMVEYICTSGPSALSLAWASPSVPAEVIEPVRQLGLNMSDPYSSDDSATLADAVKSSNSPWTNAQGVGIASDEDGWPLEDGQIGIWAAMWTSAITGTYYIEFNGKATLSFPMSQVVPLTYDPATNISSGTFVPVLANFGNFGLPFTNTQRTATSPLNSGITNLKIMRPTAPGASTYLSRTSIHYPYLSQVIAPYTVLRFMAGTNNNVTMNWSDRTSPTYFTQHGPPCPFAFEGNQRSWEYMVMEANARGKDLYLNIPELATGSSPSDTTSYVYQLAQLIKNGSTDHNGQYYPPLNSNLKVYVEYSNEVWNFGFAAWNQNFCAAGSDIGPTPSNCSSTAKYPAVSTQDGAILTFDGNKDLNIVANRRQALRIVQTSNIFRSVFGDDAMGTRVRILDEFQYDNAGFPGTAVTQLGFIDQYFNNSDGTAHVSNPQPVSYYIWGAGGANYYYGNADLWGNTETSRAQIFGTCTADALWPLAVDCANVPTGYTGGGATGYFNELSTETNWAARYGLYEVAYEGGWALGADTGGTAIQTAAKWNSPNTGACTSGSAVNCTEGVENKAIQIHDLAGGGITIRGTYIQWSDLTTFASSPLRQAAIDTSQYVQALPTNGQRLPQTLTPANLTFGMNNNLTLISPNCSGANSCSSWVSWNVITAYTRPYLITPSITAGGTANLLVDGQVVASGASNAFAQLTMTLPRGLHTITVQALSGSFTVSNISVAAEGAPDNLIANAGTGFVGLSWTAPANTKVLGYNVYRGIASLTEASAPINSAPLTGTSFTDTAVTNGTTYYYTVAAITASGVSSMSNEVSVTPSTQILLAEYNFAGHTGAETSEAPIVNAPLLVTNGLALTRGPGLVKESTAGFANKFTSVPVGNVWAQTAANAISMNQYYSVNIAPQSGASISLVEVSFTGFCQNAESTCAGALTYSLDGTTFTQVPTSGTIASGNAGPIVASFSSIPGVSNLTRPIYLRFYLYGAAAYEVVGFGGPVGGSSLSVIGSLSQ